MDVSVTVSVRSDVKTSLDPRFSDEILQNFPLFEIYYCSKVKTPLSLKYVAVEEEKETTDEEAKTIGTIYL